MKEINAHWSWEQYPSKNSMELLEKAARTCYKSEDKISPGSAEKLIKTCIDRGHESILEHVSCSVRIVCDRGISHELVRHRLASFSQVSQRYVRYSDGVEFISPYGLTEGQKAVWMTMCKQCEAAYKLLLDDGVSPQIARSVLPNSTATELVMTANLREWRHIFKLRTSKAAHPNMRELMKDMLSEFFSQLPVVFGGIKDNVA